VKALESIAAPRRWVRRLGCSLLVVAVACSDDGLQPEAPGPPDYPPDPPAVDSVFPLTELPALLSEMDLSQAVGYTPRWELWSNGLEKERRIQLPTGARIDISDPSAWRFPEGTLLLKGFAVRKSDGTLENVETRVLWRHDEEWTGVVYVWREDQSDAVLSAGLGRASAQVTNEFGYTFDHGIPSRSACITCHGASPQFVLGFGELQLNWQVDGVEQLSRLQGLDLFVQASRPTLTRLSRPMRKKLGSWATSRATACTATMRRRIWTYPTVCSMLGSWAAPTLQGRSSSRLDPRSRAPSTRSGQRG
jgi:hypothetical protein